MIGQIKHIDRRFSYTKVVKGTESERFFDGLAKEIYPSAVEYRRKATKPMNRFSPISIVLMDHKRPVGRFTLYENTELRYKGEKTVVLGSYECVDTPEAHKALLGLAEHLAVKRFASWIIGPMEGSIWERYRFRTAHRQPAFLFEPDQVRAYPAHWEKNGFVPVMDYLSNIDRTMRFDEVQLDRMYDKYRKNGAVIRSFDMNRVDSELEKLAHLSNEAFSGGFLFTPVPLKIFVEKYVQVLPMMDPELTYLVEAPDGRLDAFLFVIPDAYDPTGRTLIIKSMAVRRGSPYRGIATWLARHLNRVAGQKGFTAVIHALMRADNLSVNASHRYTNECYARYKLYAKKTAAIEQEYSKSTFIL